MCLAFDLEFSGLIFEMGMALFKCGCILVAKTFVGKLKQIFHAILSKPVYSQHLLTNARGKYRSEILLQSILLQGLNL